MNKQEELSPEPWDIVAVHAEGSCMILIRTVKEVTEDGQVKLHRHGDRLFNAKDMTVLFTHEELNARMEERIEGYKREDYV